MRLLIKFLIKVYRNLLDPALKLIWPTGNCLFTPTCSHYFEEAVEKYGAFKGTGLGIKRLLRCRPGSLGGLDPLV